MKLSTTVVCNRSAAKWPYGCREIINNYIILCRLTYLNEINNYTLKNSNILIMLQLRHMGMGINGLKVALILFFTCRQKVKHMNFSFFKLVLK